MSSKRTGAAAAPSLQFVFGDRRKADRREGLPAPATRVGVDDRKDQRRSGQEKLILTSPRPGAQQPLADVIAEAASQLLTAKRVKEAAPKAASLFNAVAKELKDAKLGPTLGEVFAQAARQFRRGKRETPNPLPGASRLAAVLRFRAEDIIKNTAPKMDDWDHVVPKSSTSDPAVDPEI